MTAKQSKSLTRSSINSPFPAESQAVRFPYKLVGRAISKFVSQQSQLYSSSGQLWIRTYVTSSSPQATVFEDILFTLFMKDLAQEPDIFCFIFETDAKAARRDITMGLESVERWQTLQDRPLNVHKRLLPTENAGQVENRLLRCRSKVSDLEFAVVNIIQPSRKYRVAIKPE